MNVIFINYSQKFTLDLKTYFICLIHQTRGSYKTLWYSSILRLTIQSFIKIPFIGYTQLITGFYLIKGTITKMTSYPVFLVKKCFNDVMVVRASSELLQVKFTFGWVKIFYEAVQALQVFSKSVNRKKDNYKR